jgi:hypothetical protein
MQKHTTHASNGHRKGASTFGVNRLTAPTDKLHDGPDVPAKHGFSFDSIAKFGITPRLSASTFLLGLGSTGAAIAHEIVQLLLAELGRLPQNIRYLLIDSASAPLGVDPTNFVQIGVDGFGTDPNEGHDQFCRHYRQLRSSTMLRMLELFASDAALSPPKSTRLVVNIWLFAGCGATSGGAVHPAITLLHDIAQERCIQEPRIHVVTIGAEISLRDFTRDVTAKQEKVVRDTDASNLAKLTADFKNLASRLETRPDGTTFSRMTPYRVYSLAHNDQSNGEAEFATVADFVQAMARAYFLRIATEAGKEVMDRFKDLDKLGVTNR